MADTTNAPKAVTDETFDAEVLKSDKPVLVDFWRRGAARACRWRRCWPRSPPRTTRSPW